MTTTMTRGDLATLLHNLRLPPAAKARLQADLDLLWSVARPGDPERVLTLGPKSKAALDRVLAADDKTAGTPRGL